MTVFAFLKILHLLSAAVYAGASFVNGLQEIQTQRRGDPREVAMALGFAGTTNRVFLVPATLVILATGIAMAVLQGVSLLEGWVRGPLLLFAFLTALLAVSIRVEDRLGEHAARAVRDGQPLDDRFHRLARVGALLGVAASLSIVMMFVWMVTRGTWP